MRLNPVTRSLLAVCGILALFVTGSKYVGYQVCTTDGDLKFVKLNSAAHAGRPPACSESEVLERYRPSWLGDEIILAFGAFCVAVALVTPVNKDWNEK